MKKIAVFLITIYQAIFSNLLRQIFGQNEICRFSPTCSEYAKQKIQEKGIIYGGYLSIIRLLKCQPFYNKTV